ncbi:alpha-xenorhabdolysin family binary toxin subunit A [Moellerella wisconsensis]|uniref:Alpha-xenorhabdolysin family binary toxin subunit A n=1 Tax=Moellerella wisconsensis TaxID=158849 RepID=A0A9Q8PZH8_9GAMM|nr:alpha-xenorhabdolysin family binary toxin subunit A [Moellerella wisconsensis]UNH29665.1 alpha-xenorhabdolysin family binary toxin subunit A [Moellerella wisconsensis]
MNTELVHDKEIDRKTIPSETLKLLSMSDSLVSRKPGIFTIEDLINIKKYINFSLLLPIKHKDMVFDTKISQENTLPIKISELIDLFIKIRQHALSWNNVEYQVKQQSIDLELTGRNITMTGNQLIDYINQMPLLERISQRIEELDISNIELIGFSSDDYIIANELVNILELIKDDIILQSKKTTVVRNTVADFRTYIIGGNLSNEQQIDSLLFATRKIKQQLEDIIDSNDTHHLLNQIELKKDEVGQLEQEYSHYVKLAFTGLAGGIIGLIITGSIFGDKAEKIRARKNILLNEIIALEEQINIDKKLNGLLSNITVRLQHMDSYFRDARLALDHLDYMWQTILAEINDSIAKFKTINNSHLLAQFTIQLKKIILSWDAVTDYSQHLILLFEHKNINPLSPI